MLINIFYSCLIDPSCASYQGMPITTASNTKTAPVGVTTRAATKRPLSEQPPPRTTRASSRRDTDSQCPLRRTTRSMSTTSNNIHDESDFDVDESSSHCRATRSRKVFIRQNSPSVDQGKLCYQVLTAFSMLYCKSFHAFC